MHMFHARYIRWLCMNLHGTVSKTFFSSDELPCKVNSWMFQELGAFYNSSFAVVQVGLQVKTATHQLGSFWLVGVSEPVILPRALERHRGQEGV